MKKYTKYEFKSMIKQLIDSNWDTPEELDNITEVIYVLAMNTKKEKECEP